MQEKDSPMRMDEAAASARGCPMARASGEWAPCLGSKCMAWRWVGKAEIGIRPSEGFCGMTPQFPSR